MGIGPLIDLFVLKVANLKLDDAFLIAQLDDEDTIFTTDREDSFNAPSSFVGKVTWFEDQTMTINLSGTVYNFCSVPRRTFEAFRGANSKGAFFTRNIKGQHDC